MGTLLGLQGVWLMGPTSNYQVRWQQKTRHKDKDYRKEVGEQGKSERGGRQGKQTTLYV